MNNNLFEICGCNLNSTYELIEDMVNLNWLVLKSLREEPSYVAREQLVLGMAYFQLPINNVNKNGNLCEISIITHVQNRPI